MYVGNKRSKRKKSEVHKFEQGEMVYQGGLLLKPRSKLTYFEKISKKNHKLKNEKKEFLEESKKLILSCND